VNSRNEFGHWEADLMIFGKEQGSANIAMVVERESRYTVLLRNNDRRSKPIMNQLISHLASLRRVGLSADYNDRILFTSHFITSI
jgi:IS30 family transposase